MTTDELSNLIALVIEVERLEARARLVPSGDDEAPHDAPATDTDR